MKATTGRGRREPRFGAFLGTGAVIGLVIGVVIAYVGPDAPDYGQRTELGFMGVFFGLLGALIAGVVAVVIAGRD
ncbi:MAG: hypothetical protein V9G19_10245 [Tetrasphaera sp.]